MEKEKIIETLKSLKDVKRNFVQTYELDVVLKEVDLNKLQQQMSFIVLPYSPKQSKKVAAIVGAELADQAKKVCDFVISASDLEKYSDIKKAKSLARKFDIFIAQQNMMPKVARFFGRVLGPRKKMPNPKAGSIVNPGADLKAVVEKLKKTVSLQPRSQYHIQVPVGHEKMNDEEIAENINTVLNYVLEHLPGGKSNIKKVFVKKTMSKPVVLEI